MADRRNWRSLSARIVSASLIAIAAVSAPTLVGMSKGFNQLDSPDVALMQIVTAAFPYGVLIWNQASWRAWTGAVCFTALAWGYFAYMMAQPYEGGGAEIGTGILMLFSPAFVLFGALSSSWLLRRR